MSRIRRRAGVVLSLAIGAAHVAGSRGARADEAVVPVTDPVREPAQPTDAARAQALDDALHRDASSGTLWYVGWSVGFGAATLGEGILWGVAHDHDARVDAALGMIRSGIGFLSTIVAPLPSFFGDADEPLAARERRLDRTADLEALGRSWLAHAGGVAVNGAAALYLWRHEHRGTAAIVALTTGTAVSEVKIWTQPTTARDLRDARARAEVTLAPLLSPTMAGLAIGGAF